MHPTTAINLALTMMLAVPAWGQPPATEIVTLSFEIAGPVEEGSQVTLGIQTAGTETGTEGELRALTVSLPGPAAVEMPADREVRVEVLDHDHWSPGQRILASEQRTAQLEILPAAWLAGTVTTTHGKVSHESVRLSLSPARGSSKLSRLDPLLDTFDLACPLDSEGSFLCKAPAGRFDLRIAVPGFAAHYRWRQELADRVSLGSIRLRPGASVIGWVEKEDGSPLVGSLGIAGGASPSCSHREIHLTRVTARRGNTLSVGVRVEVVEERTAPEIVLVLEDKQQLTGRVVSIFGPVPNARIIPLPDLPPEYIGQYSMGPHFSGADGGFRIPLPGRALGSHLFVIVPGFAARVVYASGSDDALDVMLETGGGALHLGMPASDGGRPVLRKDGVSLPFALLRYVGSLEMSEGDRHLVLSMELGSYAYCPSHHSPPEACSQGFLPWGGELYLTAGEDS